MNSHQILPLVSPTSSTGSSTYAGEDCTAVGSCSTGTQTPTTTTTTTGTNGTTGTPGTTSQTTTVVQCNSGWISDGYCDDINNKMECTYDGGDCCGPNVKTQYCTECLCREGSATTITTTNTTTTTTTTMNTTTAG